MEKLKKFISNKKKLVIAIAGILVLSIILIIAFMTTTKKEKESDKPDIKVSTYTIERDMQTNDTTILYAKPDKKGGSYGTIAPDTILKVLGISDDDKWYYVEYLANKGYIEADKMIVLENDTTDTETIEEPTTEEPTTPDEDRELPTEPEVQEETTTKETEPYVPATPIEDVTQPTEPPTEPEPQTQPPTEPQTEPPTQPVVQPVVNASCELPDVTNMVFGVEDPWNNANDLIDGVYEACVSVAQRWTRGEITGEQARQICLNDPVIMQNDDSGRAVHDFCFISFDKKGKGCTYEEYIDLQYAKVPLTGNEFLYVYTYYNGDTDTTTIYLAKGSTGGR